MSERLVSAVSPWRTQHCGWFGHGHRHVLSGENKPNNCATYTVEQILMHTDAVVDIRNVGVGCGVGSHL